MKMKKSISVIVLALVFELGTLTAQNIGINTTGITPNLSALLDVDATPGNNKGLLIPRVAFAERTGANFNPLPQSAQGLIVYQTDAGGAGEGFYYNISTNTSPNWVKLSSTGTAWDLLGNAGTVAGTNFIGTTDNIPLNFRVFNNKAGKISSDGQTFLGYQAGNSNTATTNTGIGFNAFFSNTAGYQNTGVGYQALYSNTEGYQNAVSGDQALYFNTTGYRNIAIGMYALKSNTTGYRNTVNGSWALYSNNDY